MSELLFARTFRFAGGHMRHVPHRRTTRGRLFIGALAAAGVLFALGCGGSNHSNDSTMDGSQKDANGSLGPNGDGSGGASDDADMGASDDGGDESALDGSTRTTSDAGGTDP